MIDLPSRLADSVGPKPWIVYLDSLGSSQTLDDRKEDERTILRMGSLFNSKLMEIFC